jgi:hypothetical protein
LQLAIGIVFRAMAAFSPSKGYNSDSPGILPYFALDKKTQNLRRHWRKSAFQKEISSWNCIHLIHLKPKIT